MKKYFPIRILFYCVLFNYSLVSLSQNFKWFKNFGNSGNEALLDTRVNQFGNIVSVGRSNSNLIFGSDTLTNNGNRDVVVVCQDMNGNPIWARSFGSNLEDAANTVAIDAGNNIYIGGYFSDTIQFDSISLISKGGKDNFILKLNSNGGVINAVSFGGSGDDFCNDVALAPNGQLISAGSYGSSFSFGGINLTHAGGNDVYIAKLDSAFSPVWMKGNGASLSDACKSICVDQNGDIFATGLYQGQVFPPIQVPFPINCSAGNNLTGGIGGGHDIWIAKINGSTGCYVWTKTIYGGSAEEATGIACNPSGSECYAVGSFGTNAFFDGTQYNTIGNFDAYICKLSGTNGAFLTVKSIGSTGNDVIRAIEFFNSELFVIGLFDATMNLGNGISLTSNGAQDAFIGKFDLNGNCGWAISGGGNALDEPTGIDLYNNKHIFTCGKYLSNTATYGSLPSVTNPGMETAFVTRIDLLPLTPSICVATVDSLGINNVIYWDKTSYSSGEIFKIYRDISNNNYMPLSSVPFDSLSEFTDTLRTLYAANGDPNLGSWRYKISVTDTFGNESLLSPYHQTIFFQNNQSNFFWSHYLIEGQSAPVQTLQNYVIYRDNLSDGNWTSLPPLSASSTGGTDPNFSTYQNTSSYKVETIWSISCDPSRGIINTTRSNIRNIANPIDIGIGELKIGSLNVFPNPAANSLVIEFDANNSAQMLIRIFDSTGKEQLLCKRTLLAGMNQETINISNLASGIYYLNLRLGSETIYKKIIKE